MSGMSLLRKIPQETHLCVAYADLIFSDERRSIGAGGRRESEWSVTAACEVCGRALPPDEVQTYRKQRAQADDL